MIPNSQIVILPYQPDGGTDSSVYVFQFGKCLIITFRWSLELYVSPSHYSMYVSGVLGISLACVGLIILILHYFERVHLFICEVFIIRRKTRLKRNGHCTISIMMHCKLVIISIIASFFLHENYSI